MFNVECSMASHRPSFNIEHSTLNIQHCLPMKKQDKATRIGEILDDLYPSPPIPLEHADPFTLLVAVVLSAQTTDVQVNKVTPALFRRAATPEKIAAMSE